jgi:DNA-binding FrmR family transcriptional regulator
MPTIRDETHKKDLINRLRRVEGQLRGIQAMIEKGSDCEAVAQQLSASRRALDKAFYHVLSCAIQSGGETPAGGAKTAVDKRLEHVAELLAKFG